MSGRLEGKVAFITGAARGRAVATPSGWPRRAPTSSPSTCEQIESNPYPLSTPEDLAETVQLVEALDRRVIARQADVRERAQLREAAEEGVAARAPRHGVANAGILPMAMGDPDPMDFIDAADVDLIGVMNAVAVAIPHLPDRLHHRDRFDRGHAAGHTDNPAMGPGGAGYGWAKRMLIGYVEQMALHLAPQFIRVNAVHPTN